MSATRLRTSAVIEALISAGGRLLGGFLDRRAQREAYDEQRAHQDFWNKRSEDFAREQFRWNQELARSRIQKTAADARKAGLHPLFALGAGSSSGSSVGFHAGTPARPSGSALGAGVAGAGDALARGLLGRKSQGLQARLVEAQIAETQASARRNIAEANFADSRAARETQRAMVARTTPLPDEPDPVAKPLHELGFENVPTPNVSLRSRVQLPDGRHIDPINPEAGDEVSQVDLIYQLARLKTADGLMAARNWLHRRAEKSAEVARMLPYLLKLLTRMK